MHIYEKFPNAKVPPLYLLDNLQNIEYVYNSPNCNFVRFGNFIIGNGGISELTQLFPNGKLTFNPKFFPKYRSYSSTQSSNNTYGELTININGTYKLTGSGASFNIVYWI